MATDWHLVTEIDQPRSQTPGGEPPLGLRALRSVGWGAVNVGLSRILQFVATIIAAQLLAPNDFGALAVALTIQMVAMNMSELGATATLGRAQRDPDLVAPTVYTIALVTSVILAGAMAASASWIAAFMRNPEAAPVIQVMSMTILLSGISSVPTALIWRDFHQRRRLVADVANVLVMIGTMVPMALADWGAMSLAWSRVAGQLVATILFVWLAPRFYRPGFSVSEAKPALRLGLPLAASNVVVFATLNVDYIIIGRTLSPALLGVYLLAFNLAALPSTVFTSVIRTVAVPAFGRLQLQDRLPEVVPRTIAATVLISAPVCAILAALGGPILNLLFGSEWTAAAAAMAGLAVFSIGRVVTELLADLLVAVGATAILFCIQALWFLALLPTTLVGVHYMGIAGAAVAHAAVIGIVVIPLYAWSAASKAGVGLRSMLVSCSPSLLSASVAAPCGWVVAQYIPTAPLQVVCGSLVIVSVYSALVRNEVARTVSTVRQLT